MKAILCTHYGGPDELELADIPAPTAGPNEAVVRIKAAALNFFDTLIIAGKYQYKPPFPFSPASSKASARARRASRRAIACSVPSARAQRGKASRWRRGSW